MEKKSKSGTLRVYLDEDVLTAAKRRINHIIDVFDNVIVCFGGGKDSLVVLHLVEEIYKERGIKQKVKVIFRDEELIPDNVVEFVQDIYKSGRYDFRYYAIPLKSQKFVLGRVENYVQWDSKRRWVRQPPEFAIRLAEGDKRVFDQYSADAFVCKDEKGSCALLTGIRADESLLRFSGVVRKKNEPYITATQADGIKLCKPIYDWSEKDVFLYFFQRKIQYCEIYDEQVFNRERLRVSTALHAESAKHFDKLKSRCPKFWEQCVDLFPDMLLQDKYYKDYKKQHDFSQYSHDERGLKQFIDDVVEDRELKKKAYSIVQRAMTLRKNRKPTIENRYAGYPLMYVFECIAKGNIKRGTLLPCMKMKDEYIAFEENGRSGN